MKRTPTGTAVGVDDPYEHVDRCDHLTDDGRCRFAFEQPLVDPTFTENRRTEDFRCPVGADRWHWSDCLHFKSCERRHACRRCGLEDRPNAHRSDRRSLLEDHHLSYADHPEDPPHEITVTLCRWCHAKVHKSWARITDDANPDPEAIAAAEQRRSEELAEAAFRTAADIEE